MFASRVFWKLIAAMVGLYLLASLVLGTLVSRWQVNELVDQVDERLRTAAVLSAEGLAEPMQGGRSAVLQESPVARGTEPASATR